MSPIWFVGVCKGFSCFSLLALRTCRSLILRDQYNKNQFEFDR
jgi:hypothetical protein